MSRAVAGIEGTVALVTGAAQGIGAACARALAAAGARVVLTDIDEAAGAAVAAAIGERACFERHDVASAADWKAVVAAAEARFGAIATLVNNAAIARFGTLATTQEADLRATIDVNLVGVLLGMQAAAPSLRRAGGGSIVNTGAITAFRPTSGLIGYAACKWAIRGATRSAAQELGRDGIRVNAVHPGMIDTPMTAGMPAPAHIPLPRKGTAQEVADLVLFLASDAARYITGTDMVVDGGMLATA